MNILLPIETINREIDFKLVISSYLSGKGHDVYIGQHDFLIKLLPYLKGGIYIGKNMFKSLAASDSGETYKALRDKNFNFIYLNEEGAVFAGEEKEWMQMLTAQYNMESFNSNDVVCTWGEFQRKHDASRNVNSVPLVTTGHPRFDLYKPEWGFLFKNEVDLLKKKYGTFILVNGNFGTANHGRGISYVFSKLGHYNVGNTVDRMQRVGFFSHSAIQMVEMVKLTHQLAIEFPDKKIIYRPHPSENNNYYISIFQGVDNIIVKHEGSVNAWILAAEVIIHDGCTTAIEATIANKNVINFKATKDSKYDIWLPKQMGTKAYSFEEVAYIINNYNSISNNIVRNSRVDDVMYNFGQDSFKAFYDVLDKKITDDKDKESINNLNQTIIHKIYLMNLLKIKLASLHVKKRKAIKYHNSKFRGFDKKNIEKKVSLLETHMKKTINLKFYNPNLIKIQ